MNRPADFHVHPDYSVDAIGSIRQYCDRALEIGLGAICLTTHHDCNPRRVEYDGYWIYNNKRVRLTDGLLQCYLDEIENARLLFADFGLKIYRGLEVDYFPGVEDEVMRLRNTFPIDFVIGSVHCLDDIAISEKQEAPKYFNSHTVGQLADDYFRLLELAAACPGIDSVGHLDYYIRYCRDFYGNDIDKIEIERYRPVFEVLVKNKRGFEINTSPFRYGIQGFHPNEDIIRLAIKSGVKIASVGSDTHTPSKLSLGLNDAYQLLDNFGIQPVFPAIL